MPRIPLFIIDAFTTSGDRPFSGNPAAVCPLERWLPNELMQQIAAENNLPMTAFFMPQPPGHALRWFLPAGEERLCGHATLATAHVLVRHLGNQDPVLKFETLSGSLAVHRDGERLVLDFPSLPATPVNAIPPALTGGLQTMPHTVARAMDWLAVLDSEDDVRALAPDFARLAELDGRGIIVTAPGRDVDFVSRFFSPRSGLNEDPVTGSAHCTLIPYWAQRLGRNAMRARQLSARGGDLWCELAGGRVRIGGHAVTYLTGKIAV